MSDRIKIPEQLTLPFSSEDATRPSAQVFILREHRLRAEADRLKDASIPKFTEKKIIDRILERAERLSWYK